MKNTFRLGCIIRKPQAPTRFQRFLTAVLAPILNDWLGFLSVVFMIGAVTCMLFRINLACIILFSICLIISLLRLITNKDNRTFNVKIFNVIITIILLASQIF